MAESPRGTGAISVHTYLCKSLRQKSRIIGAGGLQIHLDSVKYCLIFFSVTSSTFPRWKQWDNWTETVGYWFVKNVFIRHPPDFHLIDLIQGLKILHFFSLVSFTQTLACCNSPRDRCGISTFCWRPLKLLLMSLCKIPTENWLLFKANTLTKTVWDMLPLGISLTCMHWWTDNLDPGFLLNVISQLFSN